MINPTKLASELISAGIAISGCNDLGIVWDEQGQEIQTRADVAAIIQAHDPAPVITASLQERLEAAELMIDLLLDTQESA